VVPNDFALLDGATNVVIDGRGLQSFTFSLTL
jgi:hypothetical protein